MKNFFSSNRTPLRNLRLQTKILALILLVAGLIFTVSVMTLKLVQRRDNRLIYRSLAASLNASAYTISQKLNDIGSLSNAIVSNQYIRRGLISLAEKNNTAVHMENVDNTITSLLTEYHHDHPEIGYIQLTNPYFSSSSYKPLSSQTPDTVWQNLISTSQKSSGFTSWVTDYCNQDGLFLIRDCRRIYDLKQEILGTVIISVDMDKLIDSARNSIFPEKDMQFILYQHGKEIYHSKSLSDEQIRRITDHPLRKNYDVISVYREKFFLVRSVIPSTGWDYICIIPYTDISRGLTISLLIGLFFLLLTFSFSVMISSRIVGSITNDFSDLIRKMDDFGKDELTLPASSVNYSDRKDEAGILHNRFDSMTLQIQNLIRQNYVNELIKKDARLKALESQINPHFLYNALDCVYWRAKVIGDDQIPQMVESLGSLLRASLSKNKNIITLEEELKIVGSYMTIQKFRFDEERLDYAEDIPSELKSVMIPQMSIQPLVDNAINYAMEMMTEQCRIRVSAFSENKKIHIRICNTGSQFEYELMNKLRNGSILPHGIGIGLLNINDRIQLIYGQEYGLSLYNPDSEHAVAEIVIPEEKDA